MNLELKYAINTHVHADHITSSGKLKQNDPSVKSVISASSNAQADVKIKDGFFSFFWFFFLSNILNRCEK